MHKQPFVIGELVSVHFVDFVLVLFWYRFSVNSLIGLYREVLCGSLLVLWDQSLVMCWLTSNGRWNSGCIIGICNDQEKSFHQNEFLNFSLLPRFGMSMEIVRREQIRESSWIIAFIYYQLKRHVLCLGACKLSYVHFENAISKFFHIGLAEHCTCYLPSSIRNF
jgi:hypothetical protein